MLRHSSSLSVSGAMGGGGGTDDPNEAVLKRVPPILGFSLLK